MKDILIVEDGLHERERLAKLFSFSGYSVCSAESVAEAERLLAIEQFRLAVIDIGLGDKSGTYLFEQLKRYTRPPFVVVLTGNPSIHLKQRFLDEGAAAYVVKASPAADNDSLLALSRSLLGNAKVEEAIGIPLHEFIKQYLSEESRELFLDSRMDIPPCASCGAQEYVVYFNHKTQLPPLVEGKVVCLKCLSEMDPEVK